MKVSEQNETIHVVYLGEIIYEPQVYSSDVK